MVDTLFSPEKFVLLLDENRFGPVNAAVSSVKLSRLALDWRILKLSRLFRFISKRSDHE